MKKRLAALLACCLIAALAVLAGCAGGGGASSQATEADKAAFVGSWDLYEMEDQSTKTSAEEVETFKQLGLTITLDLNDDGTAALNMFGDAVNGTWEAKARGAAEVVINGDTAPMTLADDILSLELETSKVHLKKAEAQS